MSNALADVPHAETAVDLSHLVAPRNPAHADYTCDVIVAHIREFEASLDDAHEVGLSMTAFVESLSLAVTEIGYSNPNTLIFRGFVGEQEATLIQHQSQLNFLLMAIEKADPEQAPRRIGFVTPVEKALPHENKDGE